MAQHPPVPKSELVPATLAGSMFGAESMFLVDEKIRAESWSACQTYDRLHPNLEPDERAS